MIVRETQTMTTEDQPRSRGSRSRERALLPGIFLMLVGGLGFLGGIANAFIQASGMNDGNNPLSINNSRTIQPSRNAADREVVAPILNIVWSLIVFFGGLQ